MLSKTFFINWYKKRGRWFPWRESSTTPFQMLVTEMLLRQTRAANVERIWKPLIEDYPSPITFVEAKQEELEERIKILGFGRQRAEALQLASEYLLENYQGEVPSTLSELLRIPHIGNYSARAILSFAFGEKIEIVDTNVLRLFGRYFDAILKPDIRRAPEAWEIARQLLPRTRAKIKEHNYGVLDFTADVCKSISPLCEGCPLNESCKYGQRRISAIKNEY